MEYPSISGARLDQPQVLALLGQPVIAGHPLEWMRAIHEHRIGETSSQGVRQPAELADGDALARLGLRHFVRVPAEGVDERARLPLGRGECRVDQRKAG